MAYQGLGIIFEVQLAGVVKNLFKLERKMTDGILKEVSLLWPFGIR